MTKVPLLTRIILVLAIPSLSGCHYSPEKDESSPYYVPDTGSRLHLKRELTIPAHRASIYIQGGVVVPFTNMDQYHPNCKFELDSVSHARRVVKPDTFTVKKVKQWDQSRTGYLQLASRLSTGSSVVGYQPFNTIMYLEGEKQKNVYAMTCGHWEDPPDGEFLTIRQIRSTLGSIFTLELVQ